MSLEKSRRTEAEKIEANIKSPKRSSRELIRVRISLILIELKNFRTPSQIIEKYQPEWAVTERTIHRYIQKARKVLQEDWDVSRHALAQQVLSGYCEIYNLSKEAKQYSNSIAAINGLARISRIDPAAQKDLK